MLAQAIAGVLAVLGKWNWVGVGRELAELGHWLVSMRYAWQVHFWLFHPL